MNTQKQTTRTRRVFPNQRLIPARVVVSEFGIPYSTLRDIAHRGEIAPVLVGRSWFFDRQDIEAWIAVRKTPVRTPSDTAASSARG